MGERLLPGQRVVHTDTGKTGVVIATCDDGCCAQVEPDIPWSALYECPAWKLAPIDEAP